jgi:hypothetical protein
MAMSLPGSLPVPMIVLGIGILLFILVTLYAVFITMFGMQIPHFFAQLMTQVKRRPLVMMHYVNRRAEFFAPKRHGDNQQKNTLTLPEAVGAKFDASGVGLEELFGKSVIYNYFTKASFPVAATDVKAVNDFYKYMGKNGIPISEELIDVLFVEECDITGVYTKPLEDAILKSLPISIETDKEYLLNESRLKQERTFLDSKIKDIEDAFQSERELNPEYEMNYEKWDEYNNLKAQRELAEGRWNELSKLKQSKEKLKDLCDEIEVMKNEKDKLLFEIDETLGYFDPDTKEQIYSLKRIKAELDDKVITEGLFVYPKIHDMIFAASYLNSSGMNEAVNIANADAYAQNMNNGGGMDMKMIFMFAIILITVLIGGGIAIKAAFG